MKLHYKCPVCGYAQLTDPPADYTICPCCGTEFEADDFDYTYRDLRRRWIAQGMPWFSRATARPRNWDAFKQLAEAGYAADLRRVGLPTERTVVKIGDVPVSLFTRFWDWFTYRPWTADQLAERVAKSVANTSYRKWHGKQRYVELPMDQFTMLTPEEIANNDRDYLYQEHLEFERIRARLIQEAEEDSHYGL